MKEEVVSAFLAFAILVSGCSSSSLTPIGVLYLCPEEPIAITCESTGLLIDWRIVFSSLSHSDTTQTYVAADPEGLIHTVASNGLDMVFNLTVNRPSQLVSMLTVTWRGDTAVTNTTVQCGHESNPKAVMVVQDPPASPIILNHSLMATNGSKNGIAVLLEWLPAASDASLVSDLTYTIVAFPSEVSPTSVLTTSNTFIQLFILYNQEYNITVVASNCVGNSTPAKTILTIGYCTRPITGPNVAIMENSISGLQGSMITYYCRWTPNEHMVATCLSNGSWSPDPRDMVCPSHTTIHNYNITTGYSVELAAESDSHSESPDIIVPVTSTLLVVAISTVISVFIFVTLYVTHWRVCKGKVVTDSPLRLSEGSDQEVHDIITIQEEGIYSLLQAEDKDQLSDYEKKSTQGELVYADIGNSASIHVQSAAPASVPYPSLSLQLDDSQVQYADVKPHQSTTNINTSVMEVNDVSTQANTTSPILLSDDSLDLNTLIIQLQSEVTLKWREFGLAVGLAEELLDKYSTYPPEECIVEVLDVWLRNYDCGNTDTSMTRKPTWRDVAKALREIELYQLANNILSLYKDGEHESAIMDAVPKRHNYIPLANDELPPPLPPKVIDFDEEMESPPQQEELGTEETPPPLPPPYNETSLKQIFCSSAPPIPPKNNLQT